MLLSAIVYLEELPPWLIVQLEIYILVAGLDYTLAIVYD